MKIVVIDDDALDYRILRRNLQRAFDGEPLDFHWTKSPVDTALRDNIDAADICFIDYRMNQCDGLEVIRKFTASGVVTPLVLLTNVQSDVLDQEAIRAGAADYLHKDRLSTSSIERVTRHCIARKEQEKRLIEIAYTDQLTKLDNRAAFDERCGAILSGTATNAGRMALVLFDLDHFKDLNDRHGHPFGDAVLTCFASELARVFVSAETVSRLGGDEFGALLHLQDPASTPESLRGWLQDMIETQHVIDGVSVDIGFSVGAVAFNRAEEDATFTDLLKRADRNLYADKRLRKLLGEKHMTSPALARVEIHDVVKAMEMATFQDGFRIVYQPKVWAQSAQISGLEALIRWDHPDMQLGPATFVPIAEEYGLTREMGQFTIRTCFTQINAWQSGGLRVPKVAINVSPLQLQDDQFASFISDALTTYEIAPDAVEFELTESAFGQGREQCITQMDEVARLGCLWAIDDFGTGYSSLSRIHQLPISRLKIDRSFLQQVPQNPAALKISNTIISLARNLSLSVVAEGVEAPNQIVGLDLQDTDELQGFLYHRPMPVAEVEGLLDPLMPTPIGLPLAPLLSPRP